MKRKIAAMVAVALGFAASALASSVRYDYDRAADLSRWKTMAWRVPAHPNESMTESRLRRAIAGGFEARGYTIVDEQGEADFIVEYDAAAWNDVRVYGGYYGPPFGGRQAGVERVPTGVLIVAVYDRRTGGLAWRGSVTDELASDPEKADKKTAKAVRKLLQKFPPGGER